VILNKHSEVLDIFTYLPRLHNASWYSCFVVWRTNYTTRGALGGALSAAMVVVAPPDEWDRKWRL